MADGGEAEAVVFGTEEDDFTLLFWSLLGTLSISRDNGDEEDAMVAEVDLVLADSTGVTLAGESLVGIWTELLMNITSIIMQKNTQVFRSQDDTDRCEFFFATQKQLCELSRLRGSCQNV